MPLAGGDLPMLTDKPWLGCFAGHEASSYDVAVGSDGETIVYHKSRGRRLSDTVATKVRFIVEEQVKGRWVKRNMLEDGFETKQEANDDADEVLYTATFTGDTKVEVHHDFGRGSVYLSVKIVDKKTSNPVRAGVETVVGDLFRQIERGVDKEDLEDVLDEKIKKTRLVMEPLEGRELKIDLAEIMKESEEAKFKEAAKELKTVELSSEKLGNNRIIWKTEEEDNGWLELKKTKPLYHGFYVIWRPNEDKVGKKGTRLELELK